MQFFQRPSNTNTEKILDAVTDSTTVRDITDSGTRTIILTLKENFFQCIDFYDYRVFWQKNPSATINTAATRTCLTLVDPDVHNHFSCDMIEIPLYNETAEIT
jgi:hypothetical protein